MGDELAHSQDKATPKASGKQVDKLDFVAYARKYAGFEPTEAQIKMVEHILNGDRMTILRPRKMGWTSFNKVAKEYIDKYVKER